MQLHCIPQACFRLMLVCAWKFLRTGYQDGIHPDPGMLDNGVQDIWGVIPATPGTGSKLGGSSYQPGKGPGGWINQMGVL